MTDPFNVDREERHRRSVLAGHWPTLGSEVELRVPGNGPWDVRYEQGPVVELRPGCRVVVDLPAPHGPLEVSEVECRRALPRQATLRERALVSDGRDLMPGTNALSPLGRPRTRDEIKREGRA